MKRVLFLPVGIGLAHVGRLIRVAKEVRKMGEEVYFGVGTDAVEIVKRENLSYYPLREFARSIYEEKIRHNNPSVYTRQNFKGFIESELDLYQKIKPDLVVYDTRLTVKVSAKIARIPCVSINNVDASGYYDFSKACITAETVFNKVLPPRFLALLKKEYGQRFLRQIGPSIIQAVFLMEIIKVSPTCLRMGYRLTTNPYQFFLGDLTLLADIPEYRPVKKLPDNIKLVGPIFWDGFNSLPKWHESIRNDKKIIYVTASGTGDKTIFLMILRYLENTDFTIIATTGNTLKPDEVNIQYPNLYLTDFLPGSFIMPKASLIIFPGGNATAYQALSYGVPQICTPFHLDQEDNANQLERLGTGIIINPYTGFTRNVLLNAIGRIIVDNKYRTNAKRLKKILASYNGAKKAAEEIIKFLKQ